MVDGAAKVEFEPGFIMVTDDFGRRTKHSIANMIRSADVPDVPIASLTLLTTTANLLVRIVKTLLERDILDDTWEDGYDLQHVIETLEDKLKAEW